MRIVTKALDVHFANAHEVLGSYWGHLSGGGLSIRRSKATQELSEGEAVAVRLHVDSKERESDGLAIQGHVVRNQDQDSRAMIALDTGDSQKIVLTAALSEREMDTQIRIMAVVEEHYRPGDHAGDVMSAATESMAEGSIGHDGPMSVPLLDARLLSMSTDGCYLQMPSGTDTDMMCAGTDIILELAGMYAEGSVVADRGTDRWVLFAPDDDTGRAVRKFLQSTP